MNNSSASARSAGSDSIHRFQWKWWLKDLERVPKNGLIVFSCFSCGGGSSMGYKLAGYDVIGNCEIDPRVAAVYQANLHPKYPYVMDVRDFLKMSNDELPQELFELDVLDGSPPCTSFSMAGDREKAWNTEKIFKEGQAKQKLDDLFFYYIQIAEKLKPKVVVAENVPGLVKGNAKGYVNEIFKAFNSAGYETQLFLLDAAFMGVPQRRQRCFFIARRKDLDLPALKLTYNEPPIMFGEVRDEHGVPLKKGEKVKRYLKYIQPGDRSLMDTLKREIGEKILFNAKISHDDCIAEALTAQCLTIRAYDKLQYSDRDTANVQTFPQDYDFNGERVRYICGMSVPPVMMANIAFDIYYQMFEPRFNNGLHFDNSSGLLLKQS